MTATGHALVGTLIAAKFQNPALAAPIALASHFVTDLIPHWDSATNRREKSRRRLVAEGAGDVILGFVLSYLLIQFLFPATNLIYAAIIILISQVPDWLMAPYYFFGIRFPLFVWSYRFQKRFNHDARLPWGIITQVGEVAGLYLLLSRLF